MAVASEALEAFGGAGYVEDTGLPVLLRDAQVLPIWEGTTNVLSLDALRALGEDDRAFNALKTEVTRCLVPVHDHRLAEPGPDPKRTSYGSFFSFNDPDGNTWLVQEVTTRLPGRI